MDKFDKTNALTAGKLAREQRCRQVHQGPHMTRRTRSAKCDPSWELLKNVVMIRSSWHSRRISSIERPSHVLRDGEGGLTRNEARWRGGPVGGRRVLIEPTPHYSGVWLLQELRHELHHPFVSRQCLILFFGTRSHRGRVNSDTAHSRSLDNFAVTFATAVLTNEIKDALY